MANETETDFASMVPDRNFGTYPPPLASFDTFTHASKRLVSSLETVASIAKGLGYASPGSLTAAWRKLTGYTPTAWALLSPKKRRDVSARVREQLDTTSG